MTDALERGQIHVRVRKVIATGLVCLGAIVPGLDAGAQSAPRRLPGPLMSTTHALAGASWNPCVPQVLLGYESACQATAAHQLPAAEASRYATYRAGFLHRHLVMGRALSRVWLKEWNPAEDPGCRPCAGPCRHVHRAGPRPDDQVVRALAEHV